MPKRKIRHATVTYFLKDSDGKPLSYETVFRNQIVDIPEDQVERLDSLGATVPADADLDRPGSMLTLPDTATDAEILSWVMGATNDEVDSLVRERPATAGRILAAKESVENRFSEQNLHLGGLQAVAKEQEEAGAAAIPGAGAADNSGGTTPVPQPSTTATPAGNDPGEAGTAAAQQQGTLDAAAADKVVAGNAKSVADYIADNPANAAAVLEAEGRLAASKNEQPRVSVVRAAEAAAGFSQ